VRRFGWSRLRSRAISFERCGAFAVFCLTAALQTNKTRRCVRGAFAGAGVILVRARSGNWGAGAGGDRVVTVSSGIALSAATTRPGRQEKPADRVLADWLDTRLGATSRMRSAKPVDKASKTEEARWSDVGLLSGLKCRSMEPTPNCEMVRTRVVGRAAMLCSVGGGAYINGSRYKIGG
jgi:hypothetical protein